MDGPALVRALTRGARERRLPHGGFHDLRCNWAGCSSRRTSFGQAARSADCAALGERLQQARAAGNSTVTAFRWVEPLRDRGRRAHLFRRARGRSRSRAGAALAAVPNDPSRSDPYRHGAALNGRHRYVLNRMAAAGFVTRASGRRLRRAPRTACARARNRRRRALSLSPRILRPNGQAVVQTTIDLPLQRFVESQTRAVAGDLPIAT